MFLPITNHKLSDTSVNIHNRFHSKFN